MFGDHAMLVQRPQNRGFFSSWYSKAAIEELLRTETLHYGTNVDVTHFDGQVGTVGPRPTLLAAYSPCRLNTNQHNANPPPAPVKRATNRVDMHRALVAAVNMDDPCMHVAPQARITYNSNAGADGGADDEAVDPAVLWRRYQAQGCSVRLLHPQRWCAALAARLARLEEVFQSCVGCNAYLTPPGSQACQSLQAPMDCRPWRMTCTFSHACLFCPAHGPTVSCHSL